MPEIYENYQLQTLSLEELNRVLNRMGERLDLIQGYRGTPSFPYSIDSSLALTDGVLGVATTESGEVVTAGTSTKVAVLRFTATSGTAGGTYTVGDGWVKRGLTEEVDPDDIVELAVSPVSQFTLGEGTYHIFAEVSHYSTGISQARLFNVTDNTYVYGLNAGDPAASDGPGQVTVSYVYELTGDTVFEIHFAGTESETTNGRGYPGSFGLEVYVSVTIAKLT